MDQGIRTGIDRRLRAGVMASVVPAACATLACAALGYFYAQHALRQPGAPPASSQAILGACGLLGLFALWRCVAAVRWFLRASTVLRMEPTSAYIDVHQERIGPLRGRYYAVVRPARKDARVPEISRLPLTGWYPALELKRYRGQVARVWLSSDTKSPVVLCVRNRWFCSDIGAKHPPTRHQGVDRLTPAEVAHLSRQ